MCRESVLCVDVPCGRNPFVLSQNLIAGGIFHQKGPKVEKVIVCFGLPFGLKSQLALNCEKSEQLDREWHAVRRQMLMNLGPSECAENSPKKSATFERTREVGG